MSRCELIGSTAEQVEQVFAWKKGRRRGSSSTPRLAGKSLQASNELTFSLSWHFFTASLAPRDSLTTADYRANGEMKQRVEVEAREVAEAPQPVKTITFSGQCLVCWRAPSPVRKQRSFHALASLSPLSPRLTDQFADHRLRRQTHLSAEALDKAR